MSKARELSDLLKGVDVDGTVAAGSVTAYAVNVAPTTGYANIEMGGPDGAYIDLKSPFSDDYDGRIITNGTGLAITTGSGSGSVDLQHQNATKLSTTATGVDVTGIAKTSLGFQFGNSYLYEGATDQVNMRIGTDGPYLEFIDAGSGIAEVGNSSGPLALTASGTERMRIDSTGIDVTGNVKLDADNAGIQLKSGGVGTEGRIKWTFNTDSTVYAQAGIAYDTRATDGFLLDVGYPITLDATTNIKFKISGSEEMRLEADGDLHVDGNVIAYSTTISDIRLKKDIAPIEDAVTKVQQLNGCTFTYLKDDRKSAGLIAQDVEKVLPSAVIEDEAVFHGEGGETYKTVQYDQVIGLLVEAVKELKAEIEELKDASSK
jgi:hypothetical protein